VSRSDTMAESTCIEFELPEFMNLLEADVKKDLIKRVSDKMRPTVSNMFAAEMRKILAKEIDAFRADSGISGEEPVELSEPEIVPTDNVQEVKKVLKEEILSSSEKDALQKLKLSLAQGEIDEPTFQELKKLISAGAPRGYITCKKCGRELEPAAKFCRFCGAKIT
jgi:hypothetical protein